MQAAHQVQQVFENIQRDLQNQAERSSDEDSEEDVSKTKQTQSVHNFYNRLIQLNENRLHRSNVQIGTRESVLEKMSPDYHKEVVLNSDVWYESKDSRQFHDGRGCAIFYPDSPGRVSWDAFGMIMILYQSILVPYRLCFEVGTSGAWGVIETIIDICFMVDILVNFNTAYYSQGKLVTSRKQIAINYLKFWFWLDLVASFPYSWVFDFNEEDEESEESSNDNSAIYKTPQLLRLIKFIKFLRILRLLRVLKLKKILVRFEDYFLSSGFHNVMGIAKLIVAVFFIGHWSACFWWAVGISHTGDTPGSWIRSAGLLDAPVKEQYITSLYWAFTTMTTVGYGDIYPVNTDEKLFSIFMMLIASGVFAYIVGSMGALVSKANYEENKYKETVKEVTNYLVRHDVPSDLKFRVRRYLEFNHEKESSSRIDDHEIFKLLSKPLKERLCIELHGSLLLAHPLFCKFQPNFLSQITQMIREKSFAPADLVFEEGDVGDKLYFIKNGIVEIFQGGSNTVLAELRTNDYFGDIAFFSTRTRCASARCLDFSDLAFIHKKKFETIVNNYPDIQEMCDKTQTKIEARNDFGDLGLKCYLCEKKGHIANKCRSVHLKINHANLQKKWFFSKSLQNRFVGLFAQPDSIEVAPLPKEKYLEKKKLRPQLFDVKIDDIESADEEEEEMKGGDQMSSHSLEVKRRRKRSSNTKEEIFNRLTVRAREDHSFNSKRKDTLYFGNVLRNKTRTTINIDLVRSEPEVDLELRNQVLTYLETEQIRDPKAFRMLYRHLRALPPEKRPKELYETKRKIEPRGLWTRWLFPMEADSFLTKIVRKKLEQMSKPTIRINGDGSDEEDSLDSPFTRSIASSSRVDSETFSRDSSFRGGDISQISQLK